MVLRPGYDAIFGPDEWVEGRPFTDPAATRADEAIMGEMLGQQREIARVWAQAPPPEASLLHHDAQGRRHWLVVPDPETFVRARDVAAIGFFGQRREGEDHAVLFDLEEQVVDTFPVFAKLGFLSYFDLELEGERFGNLILFGTPDVPEQWQENDHPRQPETWRARRGIDARTWELYVVH